MRQLHLPGEDPLWYRDAIIYELHVRGFYDSDADGVGDFAGLVEKLDYLEDIGVTAIWLLPFYPSPLKDDGYDISDYHGTQPVYGTMADFKSLVDAAHRRGIRVITELVINHTSDQHPWFQRARRAPRGSRLRDYYVWSDTAQEYSDARIIFKDFETSNWAWDPVAKAYYWHRFYSHQPDLNFDNSAVRNAIFRTMDFWLKMGVDGFRVDAVPYLFEHEGTSCENLPETHAFVKELRKHIDSKFTNRMLLAEANQWPEDAAAYFGNGDEFHMAFHFPMMPRLFMAIRMEDRFPIVDILEQTPSTAGNCQWATFLRNHDELTLEMVTDEERDYMYRVYAHDPVARINLGIRRRLAPLLNNDRRKIELMNALLFALPGTPVIYYGDEIGMGDNIYLGDRNGVRTPMQWSPERNGGFSRANPQRLYLPTIIDPEYHYEAVNVETQLSSTDSLLSWMKRLIALRKRFKALGRGSLEFVRSDNRKVLSFVRRYQDETILFVANLSMFPQQTSLDLSRFAGARMVDIFGHVEFAPAGNDRYFFTPGPYAYYCFSLLPGPAEEPAPPSRTPQQLEVAPIVSMEQEAVFSPENRTALAALLREYMQGRRWFRSKSRQVRSTEILDIVPMPAGQSSARIILVRVDYTEGEPETYVLPLQTASTATAAALAEKYPQAVIGRFRGRLVDSGEWFLYDALFDRGFDLGMLLAIRRGRHFHGEHGVIAASHVRTGSHDDPWDETSLEPTPVKAEQTNTSVIFGNRLILKLFRRLDEGVNPELEIGRLLTEKTAFANIAPMAGFLEYRLGKGQPMSLAVVEAFVPNEGDAWRYTLDSLQGYLQRALAHPTVQVPPVPRKGLMSLLKEPPALANETIGPYLSSAGLLGQRTAEMHLALASVSDDPAFAPEPFTFGFQKSLYQGMRSFMARTFLNLREGLERLPAAVRDDAGLVLGLEKDINEKFARMRDAKIPSLRIRYHGDYHLGQVLYTGKDFVIIDFEGEPARPLSERRIKRSPLRDVAGMIRSFDYAAHTAVRSRLELAPEPEEERPVLEQWAKHWYVWVSVAFLNAYIKAVQGKKLLPDDPELQSVMMDAFLLDKAVYEVGYELNNRPDWVEVPLHGILDLMQTMP